MYNKKLKFEGDAKGAMLQGIQTLAKAVGSTLGPKGQCVIISDNNGTPRVTKDGVSVAKEIKLEDPFVDAGVQLAKEAAVKTLASVGDATTTSTVLMSELCSYAHDLINDNNYNPVDFAKGINQGLDVILKEIDARTIPVKNSDIKNIATISANNDTEIGELISDAIYKIGRDGIITVQPSATFETKVKVVKGMQFERGYTSPHFVTDQVKNTCVLENPYILITNQKLNKLEDIIGVLNPIVKQGKSLLIIAEDYSDDALETLKYNKISNVMNVCAVKAPSFAEWRSMLLDDIAILTNGTHISYDSRLELTDITLEHLGTCERVIVDKETTTILGGKGDVSGRIEVLKAEAERLKSEAELNTEFKQQFYAERISKLSGGIATIYVGGRTEVEINERKDRIDDAVAATKAAIESGVVLGGGLTYYNIYKKLRMQDTTDSVEAGKLCIYDCLVSCFDKIIENAGGDPYDYYDSLTDTVGYDACNDTFTDMYKAGIIDPAKAAKLALVNAVSVATMYLTTNCMIVPDVPQIPVMM